MGVGDTKAIVVGHRYIAIGLAFTAVPCGSLAPLSNTSRYADLLSTCHYTATNRWLSRRAQRQVRWVALSRKYPTHLCLCMAAYTLAAGVLYHAVSRHGRLCRVKRYMRVDERARRSPVGSGKVLRCACVKTQGCTGGATIHQRQRACACREKQQRHHKRQQQHNSKSNSSRAERVAAARATRQQEQQRRQQQQQQAATYMSSSKVHECRGWVCRNQ